MRAQRPPSLVAAKLHCEREHRQDRGGDQEAERNCMARSIPRVWPATVSGAVIRPDRREAHAECEQSEQGRAEFPADVEEAEEGDREREDGDAEQEKVHDLEEAVVAERSAARPRGVGAVGGRCAREWTARAFGGRRAAAEREP